MCASDFLSSAMPRPHDDNAKGKLANVKSFVLNAAAAAVCTLFINGFIYFPFSIDKLLLSSYILFVRGVQRGKGGTLIYILTLYEVIVYIVVYYYIGIGIFSITQPFVSYHLRLVVSFACVLLICTRYIIIYAIKHLVRLMNLLFMQYKQNLIVIGATSRTILAALPIQHLTMFLHHMAFAPVLFSLTVCIHPQRRSLESISASQATQRFIFRPYKLLLLYLY